MHKQEMTEMKSSIRASTHSFHTSHDPYSKDSSEQETGYQPLKRSAQRTTTSTFDAFWILEIAGVIASIACLAAIIVVLAIHDGQPFSSWTFYLSLNTVVSILATTSKTTVLLAVTAAISQDKWNLFKSGPHPLKLFQDIDQASRGGVGSIRAIFNLSTGPTIMFGAFITVTSLLFQPMTQAAIDNYGRFDDDARQATVGSTSYLTGGSIDVTSGGVYAIRNGNSTESYVWVTDVQTDTGLQTATIGGFATSEHMNTSTQLAWTCPNGNCTWPIYTSLAVCSQCHDVSYLLTNRSMTGVKPLAWKDQPSNIFISVDPKTELTQYSLAYANMTIDNWEGYRNQTANGFTTGPKDLMVAKSEKHSNNTVNFQDYESLLISFSTIKADTSYMSNFSMWQDVRPVAMECGLFLCLQAYNTTVESGQLVEIVTATTRRKVPQSWHAKEDRFNNLTYLGTLDWNPINNGGFRSREDFQLDASGLDVSYPGANGTYNATQTLLYSMADYLDGLLTSERDSERLGVDYAVVYDKVTNIRKYTTPTIQSLFQSSNLTETFDNVANSMTSYLRNTGTHAQEGSVRRWTIYYKIRWPFIALPVFVVIGGTVLLMVSICQTYRQDMAVWKDNIIAAMVFSINPDARSRLRQMLRYQKLGDVGDLVVHMHELEDGIELSTAQQPDVMNDENDNRAFMAISRRLSNKDLFGPSASQTESEDQDLMSSEPLVTPMSTRTLTDIPHW